jgi:hypothetical protein
MSAEAGRAELFNMDLKGDVVNCDAAEFAAACISLWPDSELKIELPAGADEDAICEVFRAFGCEATVAA